MAVKPWPDYFLKLREIAPFVVFSVTWVEDPYCRWDGDKSWDPVEEGFVAYDVDVKAMTIYKGEEIYEEAHLGSVWEEPDEKDPEIGGYLPQMLQEAADLLRNRIECDPDMLVAMMGVHRSLTAVYAYLKGVMQRSYEKQMAEKRV